MLRLKNLFSAGLIVGAMTGIDASPATIKDPVYDDFEGVALVEALISDGKLADAEDELRRLPNSTLGFWLASGRFLMANSKAEDAIASFKLAEPSNARELELARAYARTQDFAACQNSFAGAARLWLKNESDILLKASCELKNGDASTSWKTLSHGRENSFAIRREKIVLLLELGLAREALSRALGGAGESSELLALAELFYNKKQVREALTVLEFARVKSPYDVETNLALGQIYFEMGNLVATAESFERVALARSRYAFHAAELSRKIGHRERAAYWGTFIVDPVERLKARMGLYVDLGWYSMVISLEPNIQRGEMQFDDETRYALAYSFVRGGDLERPLPYLARIQKADLLPKVSQLRQLLLACREQAGACRL